MHLAIYHCRRECRLAKQLRKFLRKFFSQYTTARENAVLTKILKNSFCLPTIPPRKKSPFWKKFAKILMKIFLLTLHSRERQKFNRFYKNSHKFHNCGYLPPTLNSWERSKVNLLGQKSFLLTLKSREGVKIKDFE